jgi:hypothetical protein
MYSSLALGERWGDVIPPEPEGGGGPPPYSAGVRRLLWLLCTADKQQPWRNSKFPSRRYPNAAYTMSGKMPILKNTKNMDDCLNISKTAYESEKSLNYHRFFFQLLYAQFYCIKSAKLHMNAKSL